jgi:hypothetical protein
MLKISKTSLQVLGSEIFIAILGAMRYNGKQIDK